MIAPRPVPFMYSAISDSQPGRMALRPTPLTQAVRLTQLAFLFAWTGYELAGIGQGVELD